MARDKATKLPTTDTWRIVPATQSPAKNNKPKEKVDRRMLPEGTIRALAPRDKAYLVWDIGQPGLCLRVRPSGAMSFKVAYQHQGKTRWFTIGSHHVVGLQFARQKAREVRELAAGGKDPQGEKVEGRKGDTLKYFYAEYLEKKARGANKSWKQGAALMQKHVYRKLGNKKLKEITRRDMWEIADNLHDRPALANAVINAASAMFTWAFKRDLIDRNPCQGIERHKTTSRQRFLSNDEIRLVWPLFEEMDLYSGTILKLLLLTAQRPGEVRRMRWEHIDLDAGLWSMPGAASSVWPGTKNRQDHEVPLTKPVLELLHELDPQPEGPVFPGTRYGGGRPIVAVSTRGLCKKAGLVGERKFTPHDLRATASTGMDALSIVRQHISLVLNHVEGGTTAGYIRHDKRQHKRRALEMWSTELMLILQGRGHTDQQAEIVELERRA